MKLQEKDKNKKYAIAEKNGNWLLETSYYGNELIIKVMTKEEAQAIIDRYYNHREFKVVKIIK